ncbi:MAG: ThiF family adenylyltransferase [Candidatus Jordarchaeaceae archaeon]
MKICDKYIFQEDRYERQRRVWGYEGEYRLGSARILLVGVGGIGTEVAKNLAAAGVGRKSHGGKIILVDPDTVALSNMNRGIFFSEGDAEKPKVEVIARFLSEFNPELNIVPICSKIEELPHIFNDIDLVVLTADSREAREYVSYHCICKGNKIVEGSLEVGLGYVRIYIPGKTPCLLCADLWSSVNFFNVSCTIRGKPKSLQECISVAVDDFYGAFKRYPEDMEGDIKWVYTRSMELACKFKISGAEKLTGAMVREIVGSSVAAIGAPNSAIGGVISMIVIQILTGIRKIDYNLLSVNFFDMVMSKYKLKPRMNCICSFPRRRLTVSPSTSIEAFAQGIKKRFRLSNYALSIPAVNKLVYPVENSNEIMSKVIKDKEIVLATNLNKRKVKSFLIVIDFDKSVNLVNSNG